MSDALQLLRGQHREMNDIFRGFSDSDDSSTLKDLAQQAMVKLEVHGRLEEEIFYPAVRSEGDTGFMLTGAEEEHLVVGLLIDQLREMAPTDSALQGEVRSDGRIGAPSHPGGRVRDLSPGR